MLDFGWTELLMIGVVAVIVIGPKDLPKAMADLAGWVRKLRGMASDFQGQVNDMVKGTELEEVQKAARGLNQYNVKRQISKTVDPKGQMKKALEETRQAANAKIDAPEQASTDAKPALASASGMVEAQPENAIGGGDSGAALASNTAAVKAMSGESATDTPPAQTAATPAKRKATSATSKTAKASTASGKKPAARKTASKTATSKAAGTKKPATRKTAAKTTTAKASAAKKPAAKSVARKTGVRKTGTKAANGAAPKAASETATKPATKATAKASGKSAGGAGTGTNGAAKPAKAASSSSTSGSGTSGSGAAKRKSTAKPKAPAQPAAADGDAAQTTE